jgi:hypothetical protein
MKKEFLLFILINFLLATAYAKPVVDTTKPIQKVLTTIEPNINTNVLVVTNGWPMGTLKALKKELSSIYPAEAIETIHVWKGEEATNRFGEKATHGAIEFILKEAYVKKHSLSIEELKNDNKTALADNVFDKVDIEAKYPGGDKQWRMFLEKNLNGNIPIDNGAPAGIYTVVVQFVVSKDGSISAIKPLTDYGYGTEKEVVRVISKGPKWEPAIQDGRMVMAYRKQPVTFMVQDDEIDISTYTIRKNKNNAVEIKVLKTKDEHLEITAIKGTIQKLGEGMYNITTQTNERVILTIFDTKKKKEVGKVSLAVTD